MKQLILISILPAAMSYAFASDYGREIIKISNDKNNIYYITFYSTGDSISKDNNYFKWSGEFIESVSDRVKYNYANPKGSQLEIYKNMEVLDLKKFYPYKNTSNIGNKLCILKNKVTHFHKNIIHKFKVLTVIRTSDEVKIYPSEFQSEDNEWVGKSIIKNYWNFDDGAVYCKMSLFGIKDSISAKDLNFYKSKLNILKESPINDCKFEEFAKVLYRKKIIILGWCD